MLQRLVKALMSFCMVSGPKLPVVHRLKEEEKEKGAQLYDFLCGLIYICLQIGMQHVSVDIKPLG